jgi:hypothetical protein
MKTPKFKNELTCKIVDFLNEINIEVESATLDGKTFMPGISIDRGILLVDEDKLKYPGDLLHEAGHLAVKPSEKRMKIENDAGKNGGEELMAIAWSYAALVYLNLEPSVVFHKDGYRGDSDWLIETFSQGNGFGIPTLQWIGLTADTKRAAELGIKPYPHMLKWLRD